ncbi:MULTISPECIES: PaREP1 family protein [Pyrobaculum]|uniref:PaREP1 domain containing protein n=2 Tax=Pyrobaculum arsenaticum TaxID=121277 RepID=A4WKG2_PYRAR|nr:PaREP1 family protein [Pyrobaculum arsenaticum]ABP50879.1 PaREP1 domain containing protein [Pyrobaculum arsenaticum DSM 13514]MCY0891333.1 PaREP1 family protein [Pyrobaculum arsenaticum]NYR15402.1 hypothetical protein [Pyrobaculum arsenaticum]
MGSPCLRFGKPWKNLSDYKKGRLLEARYGAELALKFLEAGLYRNAAGKAFQAWKALLAAMAADYKEELAKKFRGVRRTRDGKKVSLSDFIIAFMPTGYMLAVAKVLEQLTGKPLSDLTNIALNLHEFQYNGLDEAGVFSRYPSLEYVIDDIRKLVDQVLQLLQQN